MPWWQKWPIEFHAVFAGLPPSTRTSTSAPVGKALLCTGTVEVDDIGPRTVTVIFRGRPSQMRPIVIADGPERSRHRFHRYRVSDLCLYFVERPRQPPLDDPAPLHRPARPHPAASAQGSLVAGDRPLAQRGGPPRPQRVPPLLRCQAAITARHVIEGSHAAPAQRASAVLVRGGALYELPRCPRRHDRARVAWPSGAIAPTRSCQPMRGRRRQRRRRASRRCRVGNGPYLAARRQLTCRGWPAERPTPGV